MAHQRAAGRLGRAEKQAHDPAEDVERRLVAGQQHRNAAGRDAGDAQEHGRFGAQPVVQPGEGEGAEAGRDIHDDAEDQDLRGIHAEDRGGVDRPDGENRVQPVDIEDPGDQEARDVPVLPDVGEGVAQRSQAGADRPAHGQPGPRRIRGEEEQRQAEDQRPQGDDGAGDPDMLSRHLVEAERRDRRLDEQEQQQDQAGQAADIAQPPGPAGEPADMARRGEAGQHGVVEDEAHLEADHADEGRGEHEDRRVDARRAPPQGGRRGDHDQGPEDDPGLAAPAVVGDGAEDRAEDRDDEGGRALGERPLGGAGRLVRRDGGGEIGREDEGRDDGGKRRVGPVVERPAEGGFAPAGPDRAGRHLTRFQIWVRQPSHVQARTFKVSGPSSSSSAR